MEKLLSKQKNLAISVAIIVFSLLLAMGNIGVASAAAWGPISSMTVNGRTYNGMSGASGANGTAQGWEMVSVSGNSMPSGWGGVQPSVYQGTSKKASGNWRYNSSNYNSGSWFSSSVSSYFGSGVSCRGRGYFAGYNSNNAIYTTMQSGYSPNQTC